MKVAIVGAGICGLYLGWKLAEKGQDVTIFEKRDRIGKEVCSGLFSERIFDFAPECKKLVQNRITSCLICFPKRTIKIRFSKPFFVISHYQLDNLTADLAEKAGAKIILNRNIRSYELSMFQEEYDRIIGCDGANSVIREGLGLPAPNFWLATRGFIYPSAAKGGDERMFIDPEKNSVDHVETWPQKSGFIWKIPRGNETEYGIIYPIGAKGGKERKFFDEKPKRAKALFEEFLTKKGLQPERTNSAIVPQGLIIPKNPKVTLCGDAAGLTKPWSGGGVIWGLTAANLLLKNFPDFIEYQKAAKRFFLPKIILSKAAKKLVYFLGFNLPWFLPKNPKIESDFLA